MGELGFGKTEPDSRVGEGGRPTGCARRRPSKLRDVSRRVGGAVQDGARTSPATNESTRPLSRKTAAERVLFYRRTLAAWAFLLAVDERPALVRIAELTALERTALPPSIK